MSNRLLFQSETKQATVRQQQPGGSHRILAPAIIGVAGVVLLGLLAVPILVGTNLFFAAGAGCSGQQTGTAGQPAAGAKAKTIPADYVGAMGGLITGPLATTLRAAYQTPGVAQLRKSQKQVSTGTAVISSLRAFGPSSMTFIVTAGQRLATANGTSSGSTQYAVTVTGSGSSWQVSDIELESAGNT